MGRFDGRVALVTGAGSGIGEATARRFAAEGAAVLAVDLDESRVRTVVDDLIAGGRAATALRSDVADPDDVRAMIDAAVETYGRLDILHNNAARPGGGLIADLDPDDWHRALAVNLTGPFLAMKHALPVMARQGGGSIVNMGSVSGLGGDLGAAAYNASKGGIINLTRCAALEGARDRIRVNCVCPGGTATPPVEAMIAADRAAGREGRLERAHPLGRLATADEVASVVLFLASEEAAFVTGAVYVVDGGLTAKSGLPPLTPGPQ